MHRYLQVACILFGFFACGPKREAETILSEVTPANAPLHSQCLGVESLRGKAVPVDWDDHSRLRVCLLLQNDGALAFDLRLRGEPASSLSPQVNIEILGSQGRRSSSIFPLLWNPFTGYYELYVSQGCLIGNPGGCAEQAPPAMRRMFDALPRSEGGWHPDAQLIVSFPAPKSRSLSGQVPRFVFSWSSVSARSPVN
jgi:hypothetical protein